MGWIKSWVGHNPHLWVQGRRGVLWYRQVRPGFSPHLGEGQSVEGTSLSEISCLPSLPSSWNVVGTACPKSSGCNVSGIPYVNSYRLMRGLHAERPEVIKFLQKHTQAVSVVRRIAPCVPRGGRKPALEGSPGEEWPQGSRGKRTSKLQWTSGTLPTQSHHCPCFSSY